MNTEELAGSNLDRVWAVRSLVWSKKLQTMRVPRAFDSCDNASLPPVFFVQSPPLVEDSESDDSEAESHSEVHSLPLNIIKRVSVGPVSPPRVVPRVPEDGGGGGEGDYHRRVRESVGFEFPPIMSQYVQLLVDSHWEQWRKDGLITDDDPAEAVYDATLIEAHTFLAKYIKEYIRCLTSNAPKAKRSYTCNFHGHIRRKIKKQMYKDTLDLKSRLGTHHISLDRRMQQQQQKVGKSTDTNSGVSDKSETSTNVGGTSTREAMSVNGLGLSESLEAAVPESVHPRELCTSFEGAKENQSSSHDDEQAESSISDSEKHCGMDVEESEVTGFSTPRRSARTGSSTPQRSTGSSSPQRSVEPQGSSRTTRNPVTYYV